MVDNNIREFSLFINNKIMKPPKFFIVIIILLVLAFVMVIFRANEDAWICKDGAWVKHGNPSAAMPEEPCQ